MSPTLTIGEAVLKSTQFLRERGVDSPRLDAELLLAYVLGWDRLKLYLNWNMQLSEEEKEGMRRALTRRGRDREPVARIIGQREFFGRRFRVGPGAFVPRPETEWLVDRALQELQRLNELETSKASETASKGVAPEKALPNPPDARSATAPLPPPTPPDDPDNTSNAKSDARAPHVIDIGTGSGCIGISIALEFPTAVVYATEISEDALQVARDNSSALEAGGRIRFHHGHLFAGLDGPFDLVVSNPPYIASEEIAGLMPEASKHDPLRALDGGENGLDTIRELISEAAARMKPGALLILEIGEGQGAGVAGLLEDSGAFMGIDVIQDLAGLERYVQARRRG